MSMAIQPDSPTHRIGQDPTKLVGHAPSANGETQIVSRTPAADDPLATAKIDPVAKATEILTAAGFGHAPNGIIVTLGEVGQPGQTTRGLLLRSVGRIDSSESRNLNTAIAAIEEGTGLKCSSNIRWM